MKKRPLSEITTFESNRQIAEEKEHVSFSIRFNLRNEKVTLVYYDNSQKEDFVNYSRFLYSYSCNQRNILDSIDQIESKIDVCNNFLHELYLFLSDHRWMVKDKMQFEKDVHLYIEQFTFFKNQYLSGIDIPKKGIGNKLSLYEKIILLQYAEILERFKELSGNNIEKASKLLSELIGLNWENIYDAINKINATPQLKGTVKTLKTLTTLKTKLTELKFNELASKAEVDLKKINKTKG